MCRFLQSCEQSLPELTHLSLSFVIKSYPPSHFTEPMIANTILFFGSYSASPIQDSGVYCSLFPLNVLIIAYLFTASILKVYNFFFIEGCGIFL